MQKRLQNITQTTMSITLNRKQQRALDLLEETYVSCRAQHTGGIFQIDGPAGTGKTELIRVLVESSSERSIVVCAPTHKATQVLQERLVMDAQDVQVTTCHRYLEGYTQYSKTGKAIWKFKLDSLVMPDMIVLDEVSMVGDELFEAFKTLVERRQAFIVTTGDRCQLPPVDLVETPFYKKHPVQISLTRNMRNKQVTFNACLEQLRKYILDPATAPTGVDAVCEYLANYMPTYTPQWGRANVDEIPDEILKAYARSTDVMMLAHRTNARTNTVQQLNKRLRGYMFGTVDEYAVGDRLIFTDYFKPGKTGLEQVFYTNDRATVLEVDTLATQMFYGESYRVYRLVLVPVKQTHTHPGQGNQVEVYRVHPQDRKKWQAHDQRVRDEIKTTLELKSTTQSTQDELWTTYYSAKKAIDAPLDYAYCLSIHKSQGSSYQSVFVFLSDFAWMLYGQSVESRRTFFKLLYVALSRSRTTACVF
jgi:hypothetical protein